MEDGDFSILHSDALKDHENNKGLFTVGHRASQETENICFFLIAGYQSAVQGLRGSVQSHTHTLKWLLYPVNVTLHRVQEMNFSPQLCSV